MAVLAEHFCYNWKLRLGLLNGQDAGVLVLVAALLAVFPSFLQCNTFNILAFNRGKS